MKIFFTARTIDALQPELKQADYWDTNLVGFGIRVSPRGIKTWTLLYRYQRRQRRLGLGRYPIVSLADARQKAKQALGELSRDIDPAASRDASRESGTFSDLVVEFIQRYSKPQKRTWRQDERALNNRMPPEWKHKKLIEFRRRDIKAFLDAQAQKGRGVISNRYLSLLNVVFRFAVENEWIEHNPCQGIRRPVREQPRDRVLSDEEIRALWERLDNSPPSLARPLRLQLLMAARIGEILGMSWAELDFSSCWWTIPGERTKNKKAHRVPLSPQVIEILQAQRCQSSSPWVFPSPRRKRNAPIDVDTLHYAVQKLRKTLGFEFRPHDLRRTAASHMALEKVPRVVLAKILNHSDTGVTAVYDRHTYDSEKRMALEAWARRVDAICSDSEAPTVIPFIAKSS